MIDLVLSEELAVREDRRFRTGLRISKLPHHKTLDDYDFSFQPELDPRKVKDLATLSFIEAKANAALLGPPGVGKTHIAVAACRAGYSIYLTSLDDMVRNLKTAEAAGRLTSKLGAYLPASGSRGR
nr:ATP-binding protein [Streptomyces sp. CB02488]